MRLALGKYATSHVWSDWFAWHPVMAALGPDCDGIVWLETVQRRFVSDGYNSHIEYKTK